MFYLNDKITYPFQYEARGAALDGARSKGDISKAHL